MDPSAKRLRRRRNRELFDAFVRIHEVVLISLFLLYYRSLGVSAPVKLVGEIVWRFLCLSSEPLPVFFIGNLIILAVAVLSGVGDGKNGRSGGIVDDVYEEYITCQRVITAGGYTPERSSGMDDEKRIVLYSTSVVSIDRGKGSRTTAARRERKVKNFTYVIEHALETPPLIADASPVSDQQVKLNSCMRRACLRSNSVEDMSNEEFNESVDKYIAKTRRFLHEESMLEVEFDTLERSAGYPGTR